MRKLGGALYNIGGCVRAARHADDSLLQIYSNKCGAMIDFRKRHE
jgi:hypothetical protein